MNFCEPPNPFSTLHVLFIWKGSLRSLLINARLWILTDHCLGHCIIQLAQLELQVVLMRVVQRHM